MSNKPLSESIAVKMKGFAKDVYRGITKPTATQAVERLEKQLLNNQQIEQASKKAIYDAVEKQIKDSEGTIGYKMGDFLSKGITSSMNDYKAAKAVYETNKANGVTGEALQKLRPSVSTAIKKGHTIENDAGERVLNASAVAGTAITLGVAGRVASGGGLYRDRYGNTNVPGIPFI